MKFKVLDVELDRCIFVTFVEQLRNCISNICNMILMGLHQNQTPLVNMAKIIQAVFVWTFTYPIEL